MNYVDSCLSNSSNELIRKAKDLGWKDPSTYDSKILDADDWGELKRKIDKHRENYTVLIFSGGDEKLNRKAASESRIDVLLHPEKNRKDSGFDEPMAKKASKNNVALGLDFSNIPENEKSRVHLLSNWRKNLKLCEKHDTPYLITTNANEVYDLRAPRDLKSLVDSMGYNGSKAVKQNQKIIDKNTEKLDSDE